MPNASYPTKTPSLHGFGAWLGELLVACALLSLLASCSSDDKRPRAPTSVDEDGGQDGGSADGGLDADVPPPPPEEMVDSGALPGDPPPELADMGGCAVDTNKLYDLSSVESGPRPTQLAVDLFESTFGVAYVAPSEMCEDAVYVTTLEGGSGIGEPESMLVSDECTAVYHSSITHIAGHWVLAISDDRYGPSDLSTVVLSAKGVGKATRITESGERELESALAPVGEDGLLLARVDVDALTGFQKLRVRLLDGAGVPVADEVVLGDDEEHRYNGLTVQVIGTDYIGLGYRRASTDGSSAIVLEILDVATGERNRDAWVLSENAGSAGGIDLGTDESGGAVMYSLGEGTSQQLYLQLLAPTGVAALSMRGIAVGGPLPPTRIVGPPIDAVDASLAKLPRGYGVAYRVLPRDDAEPTIRVYFVDRLGGTIGESAIALALPYGGRTAIEAAYDGRIVVGWSDTDDEGVTTVTAVKLPCVGGGG